MSENHVLNRIWIKIHIPLMKLKYLYSTNET